MLLALQMSTFATKAEEWFLGELDRWSRLSNLLADVVEFDAVLRTQPSLVVSSNLRADAPDPLFSER